MKRLLRKRVWLPALATMLIGAWLVWYAERDRTLENIDPATIETSIGREVRLKGLVTESGRVLLHQGDGRTYYLGGMEPPTSALPPHGHDALLTGRITNVGQGGWTKEEWQVWLSGVTARDLGRRPPEPAQPEPPAPPPIRVAVTAKQFAWSFRYPNGRVSDELYLPKDRPALLEVTSADVIHSMQLELPGQGRVAGAGAVPGGHVERSKVTARQSGRSRLRCAEYCGVRHTTCGADVVVVGLPDFELWLNSAAPATNPAPPQSQRPGGVVQ